MYLDSRSSAANAQSCTLLLIFSAMAIFEKSIRTNDVGRSGLGVVEPLTAYSNGGTYKVADIRDTNSEGGRNDLDDACTQCGALLAWVSKH